jgi:4-hydroxybenzoate polyprenyltransferase
MILFSIVWLIPMIHSIKPAVHLIQPAVHLIQPAVHLIQPALQLIRIHNALPTSILSLSGAWIAHPSPKILLSPSFYSSVAVTQSILFASMITNDLFDIESDKINHPNRPLITGTISKQEAISLAIFFYSTASFLSLKCLSEVQQKITWFAIANVILYTPILKKIPFIKNLSCAGLVTFATFFSALSFSHIAHPSLLQIASCQLFIGSFYNEILMDIHDEEGDRAVQTYTIPILLGRERTWWFMQSMLVSTTILFSFALGILYQNIYVGLTILFFYGHLLHSHWKIRAKGFSKFRIQKTLRHLYFPLLFSFLFYLTLPLEPIPHCFSSAMQFFSQYSPFDFFI